MADPTTSNKLLAIPTRGSDSGVWDLPLNSNAAGLDGMLGGVTTIPLSVTTTILLSVPSTGSVSPTAGPNQSQNSLIKFTGTLTGDVFVGFTLPGFYIIHNQCTVGSFFVALAPASGTGLTIGCPPGRKTHVFFDGINMDYVDMPEVGSFMDMAVATTPSWMTVSAPAPWLVCDGNPGYSVNVYPALGALLGSTFGGNGITTFGVPDLRARYRIPLDNQGSQGAAGRITSAVSGINGTTIGAAGGNQGLQAHTHTTTIGDPGHAHTFGTNNNGAGADGGRAAAAAVGVTNNNPLTSVSTTNISVTVNTTGSGNSGAIPPGLVFGIAFIKT